MPITSDDLIFATVAHAYGEVDIEDLVEPMQSACENGAGSRTRNGLPPVGHALVERKLLAQDRAQEIGEATEIVRQLRDETVYGSVLLRNGFAREDQLDRALETTRREGLNRRLGTILLESGQISQRVHDEACSLVQRFLDGLDQHAVILAERIPWDGSPEEVLARLEVVLGEVASKLDFITREQVEQTRMVRHAPTGNDEDEEPIVATAVVAAPARAATAPKLATAPALSPTSDDGASISSPPSDDGAGSSKEPIPGYELIEKLGQGAMGAVFKANKRDIGITVALKVLKPDLAEDEEFVERFQREARSVGQLNHANIVKCYDFGCAERTTPDGKQQTLYYYAMEHIEGETLGNVLKESGPIPEKLSLSVTRQIAAALEHAWTRGIVHRDIKPENIMLTRDRIAKLTDLGLAKKAEQDNTLTMTGVVMGSPAYISPEQATGQRDLDCRSDIYSLGASLFHLLTGQVPFDGETPLQVMLKHMNDPVPDPRDTVTDVSSHTVALVNKMLAKKPDDRFQSHRDVIQAVIRVEQALAGQGPGLAIEEGVAAATGIPPGSGIAPPMGAGPMGSNLLSGTAAGMSTSTTAAYGGMAPPRPLQVAPQRIQPSQQQPARPAPSGASPLQASPGTHVVKPVPTKGKPPALVDGEADELLPTEPTEQERRREIGARLKRRRRSRRM